MPSAPIDKTSVVQSLAFTAILSRLVLVSTTLGLEYCERAQASIASSNLLISSALFPACKHTLTLCVPSGTVGGTTALTIIPLLCRKLANSFGSLVLIEKIGDFGHICGVPKMSLNVGLALLRPMNNV